MNWICDIRQIYRTGKSWIMTGDTAIVKGHKYYLIETTDPNLETLVCATCGHRSVGWLYYQPKGELDG